MRMVSGTDPNKLLDALGEGQRVCSQNTDTSGGAFKIDQRINRQGAESHTDHQQYPVNGRQGAV